MAHENEPKPEAEQNPLPSSETTGGETAQGEPIQGEAAQDEGYTEATAELSPPPPPPDGEVVDDADEPENPDEATRAEVEAARAALSPNARRRKYRGPQSILIMLFVVGVVIATGVYAILWYGRIKEADDRADLRKLEEREVMARFQHRSTWLKFGPDAKVLPAGVVYEPLTPIERGQMRQLQARFQPGQFKPDDKQNMLIQEVHELEALRGLQQASVEETLVPHPAPAATAVAATMPATRP